MRRGFQEISNLFDNFIRWTIVVIAFTIPLIVSPRTFDAFDLTKATLLYLFSLLLLFLYLARIIFRGEIVIEKFPLFYPVLLFVLVATISVLFSPLPIASIFGEYGRYETLQTIYCFAFIFFLTSQYMKEEKWARKIFIALLISCLFIALYGVAQAFGWDFLPDFMQRPERDRARSTLGNAVFFGGYLATIIPLILNFFFSEGRRHIKLFSTYRIPLFLPYSFLFIFCLASSLFALSRGAWLGIASGLIFVLILYYKGIFPNLSRLIFLFLATFVVVFFLLFMTSQGNVGQKLEYLKGRARSTVEISAGTAATRIEIWKGTLKMIRDRPLWGFGLDQMLYQFPKYRTVRYTKLEGEMTMPDRVHNEYFQIAADMGLLAFLFFFWLLLMVGLFIFPQLKGDNIYLKGMAAALFGYLVQAFFSITIIGIVTVIWIFFGLLCSFLFKQKSYFKLEITLPSSYKLGLVFLVFFPFLFLSLLATKPFIADMNFYSVASMTFYGKGNPQIYAQKYQRALELNPYRAIYRNALADMYLTRGQAGSDLTSINKGIEILKEGVRLNPYEEDVIARLAQVYEYLGLNYNSLMIEEAARYYRMVVEIDPLFKGPRRGLIRVLLQLGRFEEAVVQAKEFLRIEPGNSEVLFSLGQAYENLGKLSEAYQAYQKVYQEDPNYSGISEALKRVKKRAGRSK